MLTTAQRATNYRRQSDRTDFTGPQRRRLLAKLGRRARRALASRCPMCSSYGDSPCVTRTGKVAKRLHEGRK